MMMTRSAAAVVDTSRRLAERSVAAGLLGIGLLLASGASGASASGPKSSVINAVGAENEYANVLSQIGGKYVKVSSILNNPNTDPHTFEASTSVAEEVSQAQLIVQNGVGYDSFMNDIESASPNLEPQGHRGPTRPRPPGQTPRIRTCGTARRRCRPWPR